MTAVIKPKGANENEKVIRETKKLSEKGEVKRRIGSQKRYPQEGEEKKKGGHSLQGKGGPNSHGNPES